MDRHPLAVMVEGIKTIIGFALIYSFNGWYGLDSTVQFATTLISTYLVLSLMLTVYFTYYEKIEPAVHLKS